MDTSKRLKESVKLSGGLEFIIGITTTTITTTTTIIIIIPHYIRVLVFPLSLATKLVKQQANK
jgi:hypothetical protein